MSKLDIAIVLACVVWVLCAAYSANVIEKRHQSLLDRIDSLLTPQWDYTR